MDSGPEDSEDNEDLRIRNALHSASKTARARSALQDAEIMIDECACPSYNEGPKAKSAPDRFPLPV